MTSPTIAICIPTTGRPQILTETLREVAGQSRAPNYVIVCPAKPADLDPSGLSNLPFKVEIVTGPQGLCAQRNTLMRGVGTRADIILFLDDDFLMAPSYLAELERFFAAEPDCVIATGLVLADGATGPGYGVAEGRAILGYPRTVSDKVTPVFNGYGCNMAVRWSKIHDRHCWFDEALPLYSWWEDVDFSRQAAAYGAVRKNDAMAGVHLGTKSGRVSGLRFGYSQIANQVYLTRKGTVTLSRALRKAVENMASNALGSITNRGVIDRRGRLLGNIYGIADMFTGRSDPRRILDL